MGKFLPFYGKIFVAGTASENHNKVQAFYMGNISLLILVDIYYRFEILLHFCLRFL